MTPQRRQHDSPERQEAMFPMNEVSDFDGPIWVNKFTEDSARGFVKQLQYQSEQDSSSPIVINIDSYGGDVYALFTMIAAMEAIPNQIITVAYGKAMSAGAVLLSCGHIRYAAPYSTIMIHEVSGGAGGHIADINIQHDQIVQLNEKILSILAEKTKIKGGTAALKKMMEKDRDLYFTPEEAAKFGVVDRVGVPIIQRRVSVDFNLLIQKSKQQMTAQDQSSPPAETKKDEKKSTGKKAKA